MADAFHPQYASRLEDPARLQALPRATVVSLLRAPRQSTWTTSASSQAMR